MKLGSRDAFPSLPAEVDVDGHPYFLVQRGDEYKLISRVCPHQGGVVMKKETCFECPQHGWRFDLGTGRGLDVSRAHLASIDVTVRDGDLWAAIPRIETGIETTRIGTTRIETLSTNGSARSESPEATREWPADFSIRLVGHACMEIRHDGFTLLTDPWLTGPAFLGAWIPYPPANVDVGQLRPDAIWISHEHSDHFHPPTLQHFDRATPIYVADFPNDRLTRALAGMGFSRVQRMRFGQSYRIADGMRLTCFEPPGLWNDSVLLVEAGGIKLLNINDAGVNHRIASVVGPVDILAAAFNPASSYPLAWTHLDEASKEQIGERARVGLLRMLHQAVKRYQPRYLLPFAAHFLLWHPSHRGYLTRLRRNTLDNVVRAFRHTDVQVLDILPGGEWEPRSGSLSRGPDRTHLDDVSHKLEWAESTFDEALFDAHHPPPGPLSADDVAAYLDRLNAVPDIAFCEDIVVRLQATDGFVDGLGEGAAARHVPLDLSFQIASGRLSMLKGHAAESNLTMELPIRVLRHLVLKNASWDEAHVGFWCRFTRTPDVFHAGFWRLLQAPYYMRAAGLKDCVPVAGIAATSNVAELIERYGDAAERILGRYGLHCGSCPHATAESLVLAANRHGVDESMTQRMLKELNVALSGSDQVDLARA